jgi:recombination protein RecT
MSTASTNLGDKVASKAVAPANGTTGMTVYDYIQRQTAEVALALPNNMSPERFARLVITQVRQTPKLAECTPQSLAAAMMLAAQLGVEPGPLGHCYLIPRKNRGVDEVQFQLGYKGIIDLARRSGTIQSIEAREVCEHDDFTFALEENPPYHHTWDLHKPRGNAYAYYGFARFKDGGHYFLVLNIDQIEARRMRSATANSSYSPWKTDYDAMARKTVIRAMQPYLPLSAEVARQMAVDETTRSTILPDMSESYVEPDYIDAESADGELTTGGTEATGETKPGEEPF